MVDMNAPEPQPSRVSSVALLFAAVYSAAIIVAGFVVPMYSSLSGSSSPVFSSGSASSSVVLSRGSATLVTVNGVHVVFILAIPLLVTLAVWAALRKGAWRGAVRIAWALTWLLALFNLAALMSIGLYIIPVTVALFVACSRYVPRPKHDLSAPI
jgi:hypothetical protein